MGSRYADFHHDPLEIDRAVATAKRELIISLIDKLPAEERAAVFSEYCGGCYCKLADRLHGVCHCQNDD